MYWGMMGGVEEEKWRKGPWTAEEDRLLIRHVNLHGEGRWNAVATLAGLKRNGKSCRLRWVNYLRPDLKRGRITPHEETIILDLHARWGNRWSTIARSLPGRTDNEIKNYWRTHFKKTSKVTAAIDESSKVKARLLKRHKFQQQRRLIDNDQKQQNDNINNMRKIMLLLQETTHRHDNKQGYAPRIMVAEGQQDKINYDEQQQSSINTSNINPFIFPNATGNCYHSSSNYVPETIPAMNEDFGLWDALWNLDDVLVHAPNFCAAIAN